MKKTLLASAVLLAFASTANAVEYGNAGFTALGTEINTTEDIKVVDSYLKDVKSLTTTGTFDWLGANNDTGEIKANITASEFIYRGLNNNGNNMGRAISGEIVTDSLVIYGNKAATQTGQVGLGVLNDKVLDGVKAIRVESVNGTRTALVFKSGVEDTVDATITLAHDGAGEDARVELDGGAKVTLSEVVVESGKGKIQVNNTASVEVKKAVVNDDTYLALDVWTNQQEQTATFKLNEINVGKDGQFRVNAYNYKGATDYNSQISVEGDLTINLGKNGVVDLGGQANTDWDSDTIVIKSENIQVNVEDLSGDNHVYLTKEGTDLDKTVVNVSATGSSNSGDTQANLEKMAAIVQLTSNTDAADEEAGEKLAAETFAATGTTLSIGEGMHAGAGTAVVGADGKLDKVEVKVNSVMSNVLDIASAQSLSMNRIIMNDVRKRLGDLRSAEGTHGVWARYDGGKFSGSNEYENDFTTIQVGIDTVPVADAPRFGVAFAYTTSDADMKRGGAEMDAFSLAFYGTKMYDNGMFVDVIGRMATADTDVVVDGDKKGTMDNIALSLSGELGWRFDVTDKFYFEPQAELTYTYVNADTLVLSSGHEYKFDSVDSLVGRVGFAAGFKCPANKGDVYVRASAVHEFLGDATVRGGYNVHEVDGEDTWVEFGIGGQFNINKNTYVYADIERTEGAKLEEDWRANVGVRFAF